MVAWLAGLGVVVQSVRSCMFRGLMTIALCNVLVCLRSLAYGCRKGHLVHTHLQVAVPPVCTALLGCSEKLSTQKSLLTIVVASNSIKRVTACATCSAATIPGHRLVSLESGMFLALVQNTITLALLLLWPLLQRIALISLMTFLLVWKACLALPLEIMASLLWRTMLVPMMVRARCGSAVRGGTAVWRTAIRGCFVGQVGSGVLL